MSYHRNVIHKVCVVSGGSISSLGNEMFIIFCLG